jgi:hypothetical protein
MRKETAMTWGKDADTVLAELEAELAKARKAAPPPPIDDPIYQYLRRVYRLRRKADGSPELQKAIKTKHRANHPRTLKNYASVIIQLTAPNHVTRNMKHKYVTALEYAFKEGIKSKDLETFIKEQGGLNKCGELWSKKYGPSAKKRPKKNSAK